MWYCICSVAHLTYKQPSKVWLEVASRHFIWLAHACTYVSNHAVTYRYSNIRSRENVLLLIYMLSSSYLNKFWTMKNYMSISENTVINRGSVIKVLFSSFMSLCSCLAYMSLYQHPIAKQLQVMQSIALFWFTFNQI